MTSGVGQDDILRGGWQPPLGRLAIGPQLDKLPHERMSAVTRTLAGHLRQVVAMMPDRLLTRAAQQRACGRAATVRERLRNGWAKRLADALERLTCRGEEAHFFLRNDDVDVRDDSLEQLLDICGVRRMPLTLAVVPGLLTDDAAAWLRGRITSDPRLLEMHQHGQKHVNHEPHGRKCEFGISRSYEEQFADIAAGKARMNEAFGWDWFPAFTPPWNRCTETTCQALDDLGFQVLSTDGYRSRPHAWRFQEVPVTIDLFRWKGAAMLRPADEIISELAAQIQHGRMVGILLHHKVMSAAAFAFLEGVLDELRRYPVVRFHTFRTVREEVATAADA